MAKEQYINRTHTEGYVYDQDLVKRVSKNGVEYIGGIVQVATDDEALNIVPVHFIYVTETYAKSGKVNANFGVLEKIMEDNNTYRVNGLEAQKVRIDGNIGVNDFVTRDGEMASPKRVVASFIHLMNPTDAISDDPATFEADMLISSAIEHEVEEGDDYVTLGGYVFGFRKDIIPVEFSVRSEGGMKYFMDQDISQANPLCTKVWGDIVSTTIVREQTVESAFGAPKVNATSRTLRAWYVEGANSEPYEWDDESFITKAELKAALADREEHLADVKKRNEEYRNSRNGKAGFPEAKAETKTSTPFDTEDEDFEF